jgi:septation ring formation regulator EzrA
LTIAEIITQGAPTLPLPLDEPTFFRGYRDRLEDKLRHKNNQITRIQRLLGELTEAQRPIFEELLDEVRAHRDQIQGELDQLYGAIEHNNAK